MGKGPGHGSCHQGWQDLRGLGAVCWLGSFLKREGRQGLSGPVAPFLVYLPPLALQALTFIIFICFGLHLCLHGCRALLEFFITLAFLFLYATQYYQRFPIG